MNRFYTFVFILCVLIFATGHIVSVKTWVEDFRVNNLDSWKEYDDHYGIGI